MKVLIRPARIKDAQTMSDINVQCLPENYSLSFWIDTLTENKQKFSYVAEMSKLVIGYILGNEKCVISFAILPKYRNRGLGLILLSHYLYDNKDKNVYLHVEIDNLAAQSLYEKIGFHVKTILPNYYSTRKKDALLMLHSKNQTMIKPECKIKISKTEKERKRDDFS